MNSNIASLMLTYMEQYSLSIDDDIFLCMFCSYPLLNPPPEYSCPMHNCIALNKGISMDIASSIDISPQSGIAVIERYKGINSLM